MSDQPEVSPTDSPTYFDEWAALITARVDFMAALAAFKAMARAKSVRAEDPLPFQRAHHPTMETGRPIAVQIDLSEPKGDHDHCLFKSDEDEDGRKYAGQRRPQDYRPERAEKIDFIPRTMLDPDDIFHEKDRPWRLHYVCRTAQTEYFVVILHRRESGEPRYSLITAYPCSSFNRKKLKLLLHRR